MIVYMISTISFYLIECLSLKPNVNNTPVQSNVPSLVTLRTGGGITDADKTNVQPLPDLAVQILLTRLPQQGHSAS